MSVLTLHGLIHATGCCLLEVQHPVLMTRVPEATSLIGSYYPNHDEDNIWISGCISLCSGHFQNTYMLIVFLFSFRKITIETNKKIVDYLDVTPNLATGTFQPYRKPNSTPLYVDVRSCHPPQVLRQIPIGINKRLQRISCNERYTRTHWPQVATRKP